MATFTMAILQSITFSACVHRQVNPYHVFFVFIILKFFFGLQRFLARVSLPSLQRFTYGTESFKDEDYDAPTAAPDVPHQIYKGMLTKQVRAVKTFSFGTSLIGIGMQPILYEVWLI